MITREDIVRIAQSYIGVPFKHQGRDKRGIDCIGLLAAIHEDAGFGHINPFPYKYRPGKEGHRELAKALSKYARKKPIKRALPADFFQMTLNVKEPLHLALWTGDALIHAYSGPGQVVSHRMNDQWLNRIVACYAFKGLT